MEMVPIEGCRAEVCDSRFHEPHEPQEQDLVQDLLKGAQNVSVESQVKGRV